MKQSKRKLMAVMIAIFNLFFGGLSIHLAKAQIISLSPSFEPMIQDQDDDGLYYLEKIQAKEAWTITTGNKAIRVGLIDTGVNFNLPMLKGNIGINVGEIPNNSIDDDGNGYVDDYFGIDAQAGTSDPMDFHGHGTYVAGIIGGVLSGLVKETSFILAKSLDEHGSGSMEAQIKAIHYVVDRGSNIVVVTAGGGQATQAACDAMEVAKSKNVLFIVIAGNDAKDLDGDSQPIYPYGCRNDNKIVVASSNRNDGLAPYSNFGVHSVDVVSPGDHISSFDHLGRPQIWSGSSAAAAIAAGIAALALSANPTLTYQELKEIIFYGTDPVVALKDKIKSSGRVNAFRAVRLALTIPRHP